MQSTTTARAVEISLHARIADQILASRPNPLFLGFRLYRTLHFARRRGLFFSALFSGRAAQRIASHRHHVRRRVVWPSGRARRTIDGSTVVEGEIGYGSAGWHPRIRVWRGESHERGAISMSRGGEKAISHDLFVATSVPFTVRPGMGKTNSL